VTVETVLWRSNGQKNEYIRPIRRLFDRPLFSTAFVTAAYLVPLFLSQLLFFRSADSAKTSVPKLNLNIREEELKKTVKIRNKPVHDARFFEHGETKGKWENTEDMVP